jgi:hypothetical protein
VAGRTAEIRANGLDRAHEDVKKSILCGRRRRSSARGRRD